MLLPNSPFEEAYHHDPGLTQDNEGGENINAGTDKNDAVTSESRSSRSPVSSGRKDPDSDKGESSKGEDSEDDQQGNGEEHGEDDDPELAALLQMNSDISSPSDSEDETEGEFKRQEQGEGKTKTKGRRHKGRYAYEMPASTIAVLIVACWTLRIPVMCRDFARWDRFFLDYHGVLTSLENRLIEAYELPYLDPVSRNLLPANMVAHLTKHNIQALSPYVCPCQPGLT
jgi:RNA polymerase I-specific transcription initiation factor RRN7